VSKILALAVVAIFAVLALLHAYWALGGRTGHAAAVPQAQDRPLFVPSALATLVVSIALTACAVLVAASAGLIVSAAPAAWVTWTAFVLAFGLLARAVGDFRYVGFFKRVRGSTFARLDSAVYAPLCLGLALAVFLVAYVHRT
jgi:hypothetical protein